MKKFALLAVLAALGLSGQAWSEVVNFTVTSQGSVCEGGPGCPAFNIDSSSVGTATLDLVTGVFTMNDTETLNVTAPAPGVVTYDVVRTISGVLTGNSLAFTQGDNSNPPDSLGDAIETIQPGTCAGFACGFLPVGADEAWSVDDGSGDDNPLVFDFTLGGMTVFDDGAGYMPGEATGTTFYLTTVPVPAAVWLFGSALGLLGWARRRVSG